MTASQIKNGMNFQMKNRIYTLSDYRVTRIESFDTYRHEFVMQNEYLWLDKRFEIVSTKPVLELIDLACHGFAPMEIKALPVWKPINADHCYEVLREKHFNGEILRQRFNEIEVRNIDNGHSYIVKFKRNRFGEIGFCPCSDAQFQNSLCKHLAYATTKVYLEQMEIAA